MKYTEIPQKFKEEYHMKFIRRSNRDIHELSKKDPVIFAHYFLGKELRLHQAFMMELLLKAIDSNNRRLVMCLARQLGKSIGLGIFIIWACWYNKLPATISNITSVYIISRDDDASVELLGKIRMIIYDADKHMAQVTAGKVSHREHYFSDFIIEPDSVHQLTFSNRCFIKSIPPTGKMLGKSASIGVIDEAHRLKCDDPDGFYNQFFRPTLAETGGLEILSSSPQGIVGFFYELVDPEDKRDLEHDRLWFTHNVWDDDSIECKRYQSFVQSEKTRLESEGRLKFWMQEYEAKFTVTEEQFFDAEDITNAIKDTAQHYEWKKSSCCLGIDYGMTKSRTVLTVRTMVGDEIIQLFQWRSPPKFDLNLLHDNSFEHSIDNMKKRYDLSELGIIGDDCAVGNQTNMWIETHIGLPFKKFNFRSDQMSKQDGINRNCVAYAYRANLKGGKIKIPKWNKRQIYEMKLVQEVVQKILITIKAPQGQLCDTIDSDMMAIIPFLDMGKQGTFEFERMIPTKPVTQYTIGREDNFKSYTEEEVKKMIADGDLTPIKL